LILGMAQTLSLLGDIIFANGLWLEVTTNKWPWDVTVFCIVSKDVVYHVVVLPLTSCVSSQAIELDDEENSNDNDGEAEVQHAEEIHDHQLPRVAQRSNESEHHRQAVRALGNGQERSASRNLCRLESNQSSKFSTTSSNPGGKEAHEESGIETCYCY